MKREPISVFPSPAPRSLAEQPFPAPVSHSSSWMLPSRAWGRHSWVPCGAQAPRERRCCPRRAQMVLGAARDCNADSVCTAEPRHQARPALSSGARPKLRFLERVCHWELFHLPRGEGGRGKGDPLSVVQCLPQSRGRQGRGALLHPCVGVVLPAATLTALSASEVPADEPCLEGHIHLSSLHQSVLLGECQG